ncbi:hypothetical protein LZ31DRAFT_374101 [Colletotrichum somersetense]|nr:hypothetical protein LZ31DRAFT_374101 [Colletotrichum somersetense]
MEALGMRRDPASKEWGSSATEWNKATAGGKDEWEQGSKTKAGVDTGRRVQRRRHDSQLVRPSTGGAARRTRGSHESAVRRTAQHGRMGVDDK